MANNPYLDLLEQGQSANVETGGNPYLTVVEDGVQRDNAAFKASATIAIESNPDEVARQRRVAELLSVPPAAVEAMPKETAHQARMVELEKVTADAPTLRRKFTDADFAKLAHDDAENLAGIERTITGTLRDVGVTALKGAVGLPNAAVGLLDIVAGGRVGRGLDSIGVRFNDASEILDTMFSPAQQAANREVRQADGFLDTLSAAIANPSTIAVTVGESAPQILGGAGIARGIVAAAPRVGALAAGAAGEGILGAGAAASQFRANNEDGLLTGKEQVSAVGLGAGTALFAAVGGKLAQKLGIGDIDTALASGQMTQATVRTSLARELAQAGLTEGVFEELPQSAQEQIWSNFAEDKPLLEGVGNAAAMGMLAGAVTGAGFQGVQRLAMRDQQAAADGERTAAGIEKLNELAKASKVLKRDPAAVESLVQEAAAEGSDRIYIDATALLQSGVAEQVAAVSPAVAEQIAEKAATGGMVEIPLGEYVARIAPTDFAQQLADIVKVDPSGFTRAEAREFYQTQGAELQAQVEAQLASAQVDDEFRASRDRVKQTLLDELNALGRFTPDKNEFDATLIASRVAVRASQLGITPEQFFEQQAQRLRVMAEPMPGTADTLTQVTPEQALTTNVPLELPTDQVFADAVANTQGAEITDEGLLIDLVRFQKPEQEGAQAIRTGVFYLPAKSADVKHYRNAKTGYGGNERFNSATLIRRPLFVKGATGGAAPEQAFKQLKGKEALAEMSRAVTQVITRGGNYMRPDPALKLQLIEEFLDQYAPESVSLAPQIERVSREGNTLRYALQEIAVAHAVRASGYDAVVGYSNAKTGPRISEVFDVREQTFPARGVDSSIHGDFLNQTDGVDFNNPEVVDSKMSPDVIDFLVAQGMMTPEEAQRAKTRTAGAGGRAQQAGAGGQRAGQVAGRTVAGTAARSGWQSATAVRGPDGKPARIFRGSADGAVTPDNFNPEQFGKASGYATSGLGVFFSNWRSDAQTYADNTGGRVGEYRLDIRNPRVFTQSELPEFQSVEEATAFREALRAAGYDGIAIDYTEVDGPIQFVAFEAEQVIEVQVEQQYYQDGNAGVEQEPRDLYVGHNITAEKIRHALDLGGLPAPSLGVGRTTTGGFEGFGDITLLAPKEILESDGARTFNADVYSPRQPRPVYKPDPKRFDALLEKLRALPGGFSIADIDEVGRYGADALARSDAVKLLYLTETGQAPKSKKQKVPAEIKKAAKLPYAERSYSLRENPDFAVIAKKYYSDAVAQVEQAGETDLADKMRSHYFEDDGEVTFRFLDELARKVSRYVNENGVDTGVLRQDIAKKLRTPAQSDAFEKWVKDLAAPILGDKKLEISPSRRIPYTLDNVTAQMIKELRGGEGFNYGAGNIRAMFAAELDSVQAVQNRRGEIVSGADMQKAKSESQARLSDTLNDLKRFYKYDANGWGYMDDASRAIAEGPKGWREAFKINAESEKIIRDYLSYLNNLPTEYFETKMQRSVDLSEFTVAIVPKGTPQDVVAALEGKGLTIKTYDPKKPGARMKAIKAVDAEQDILFQSAFHGSPYRFDKFSLEHMGKGEGAQVYGWGLYFAGKREVAEYYRQTLEKGKRDWSYKIGGVEYTSSDHDAFIAADMAHTAQEYGPVDKDWAESELGARAPYDVDRTRQLYEEFSKQQVTRNSGGQLYEVNIPEDGEYLLWDKPLSEQPEKVRAALESLKTSELLDEGTRSIIAKGFDKMTGGALHNNLGADDRINEGRTVAQREEYISKLLHDAGIAGIKYLDGTSRGAGEGSYNYVIFDDNAVEILNTFYQNQNQNQQQARGFYRPSTNTMALLKNANLSTFLHETGHYFFEADIALVSDLLARGTDLTDGEQAIVKDVSALLKWHGVQGTIEEQLRQWHTMDFEEKRVYHERTAESFEAYLFEGKAPSIELQPYFQKFRAWLTSVYKSLRDFLAGHPEAGKLNDEVRAIFDRMLATEEEIALAEQGRSMISLFRTEAEANNAGLTPEEFARIQGLSAEATADAVQDLQARALRDLQYSRNARNKEIKRLQKESAARRREVRIDVRREVMSQPVYRAWEFLTGKVLPDDKVAPTKPRKSGKALDPQVDSLFVAIAKLGGLDAADVESTWGVTDKIPQPVFGKPVLRKSGGKSIDAMVEALAEEGYLAVDRNGKADVREFEESFDAEMRGSKVYSNRVDPAVFASPMQGEGNNPEAVVAGRLNEASLIDMGLPEQIIEHLVNLRMVVKNGGWHPDLLADKFGYASGDEMVRTVAAAENPRIVVEGLTDARMLEQYGELATPDAIEREADRAIHNEVRARMVATEANALARATGRPKILAQAAKEYAATMVARLRISDLRRSAVAYGNAEGRAAKNAAKAVREGNLQVAGAEKRNQLVNLYATKAAHEAVQETDKLLRKWSEFARRPDDKLVKTYDMDIVNAVRVILGQYGIAPAKTQRAADYIKTLQSNDPEMFAVVSESVAAAEANAKPIKEMTVEEMRGLKDEIDTLLHLARRSRQMELGGDLLDRQDIEDELYARLDEIGIPDVIPGEGSAVTPAEQTLARFKSLLAFATRVESWAIKMDGKDFGGPFTRFVFGPIKQAADAYRAEKAVRLREFRDLVDTIADTLKPQVIAAPELGYTFGRDSGGSAINEIVHAILHTGNDSNMRKLLLGRGWATENADGTVNTARWDAFIDRMVAEGKITKAHFDFAQGVWDLLESTKPLAQKTHRDVFGKYFDEVTARPLQTPFGEYRGGYVPAMVDSRVVQDADLRKLADEENAAMSYAFPTTAKGFTKARVEYNKPLMLDLRTLAQHVDKVLMFSYMEMPVRDVQRVLSKKVGQALGRVDPAAIPGMLTPWLHRAAKQQVETPVPGSAGTMRFFSVLRSRAGMAAMFGNLANAVQQATGFSMAAVKVKPRLLKSAMADYISAPRDLVRSVAEASPYMATRMDNEVAIMTDAINDILLNPSLLERGQAWTMKHSYFLQSGLDNVMSPIIWTAAYNQAVEQGAEHDEAVQFANGVIRQTQGSTLPEDISRIESGNAFVRMFTQFAGYFNMQANLLGTEFVNLTRDMGLRKGYGRGLYILTMGFLIPAIVGEAIMQVFRGGPDDEDDDGYLDDWLAATFLWAPLRNATAMVPVGGQLVTTTVNTWNDKPYDDRISTSPAISMLESAVKAPVSVYKAVAEEGSSQKAVRDVGTLISMSVGLPGNIAARPIGYLTGVAADDINPTSAADMARGAVTGVASPESK